MTWTVGEIIATATVAVAVLGWFFRLESRVNLNEALSAASTKEIMADLNELKVDVKTLLRMNGKRLGD